LARKKSSEVPASDLKSLRREIDAIDSHLIELLAARLSVAKRTVAAKKAGGRRLVDLAREAEVVRRAGELAREKGVDSEAARDVFWRIIGMSRSALTSSGTVFPEGAAGRSGSGEGTGS